MSLPRIFHVNFFRKDPADQRYLWPGYGENIRVLDWVCRRLDDHVEAPGAKKTAIGWSGGWLEGMEGGRAGWVVCVLFCG